MSKYLIEKKENEVKFKRITINEEEYGDSLVELTDEELDKQLREYSQQGLYVSTYRQYQTKRHGIEFESCDFFMDLNVYKFYKKRPWNIPDDELSSGEKHYYIRMKVCDIEISYALYSVPPFPCMESKYLTDTELADIVKEYLKMGFQVNFGSYKYKKKKWNFITSKVVKEVTDDGKIIYYYPHELIQLLKLI